MPPTSDTSAFPPNMRALQILQTILLAALLGCGGWIAVTTVQSSNAISRMEGDIKMLTDDYGRVQDQLWKQGNQLNELEKRLIRVEDRMPRQ